MTDPLEQERIANNIHCMALAIVKRDTLFAIDSSTKTFTATLGGMP